MTVEGRLQAVTDGLWVAETGLRFLGMPFSARMTVAALPGGLWLHSPVPLEPLKADLDRLGPVIWRVAPNLMHHLYQGPYQAAYPDSRLAAPAELARKRPDLRIDQRLEDPLPAWDGAIEGRAIAGNKTLQETVFLHRDSRTLILTDTAVNIGPAEHWSLRLYARLNGCYDRLALSAMLKMLYRDRKAARASLDAVLDLDFDRVIPAHGAIVASGGKDALARAFAWLK